MSDLLERLQLHYSLRDASPGLSLEDADIHEIIAALRHVRKAEAQKTRRALETKPMRSNLGPGET